MMSETSQDNHTKARIYGSKFAEGKNYYYIDGNRNMRLEKVAGLEKDGLTHDELMERKRRVLAMKEVVSDQDDQESLEQELHRLEEKAER